MQIGVGIAFDLGTEQAKENGRADQGQHYDAAKRHHRIPQIVATRQQCTFAHHVADTNEEGILNHPPRLMGTG